VPEAVLRDSPCADTLIDVLRLTSLLGCDCVVVSLFESIGAQDPFEKEIDGESGPTLDLGLPLCEPGNIENRRIHDPREDIESLRSSLAVSGRRYGSPADRVLLGVWSLFCRPTSSV
jgi:hypothetical protein